MTARIDTQNGPFPFAAHPKRSNQRAKTPFARRTGHGARATIAFVPAAALLHHAHVTPAGRHASHALRVRLHHVAL